MVSLGAPVAGGGSSSLPLAGLDADSARRLAAAIGDRMRVAGRRPQPFSFLDLILTWECNHCCDYCFAAGCGSSAVSEVTLRRGLDLFIGGVGGPRELAVLLFGGEPLMAWDRLQLAVEYGKGRAESVGKTIRFDMTTNGTLLDEARAAYLARHGITYF